MINAKIIEDSVAKNGKRLTTFELEFPRFILPEFNTHRMLSRNAASSRAIPLKNMLYNVWNNPATPISWGKNQSGMQSKESLSGVKLLISKFLWNTSGKVACVFAWIMGKLGLHKQVVNRILEPWSHIKVVASSTDWDNFFHLRNHPDAQPEIHELSKKMVELWYNNTPKLLKESEWHLPYVDDQYNTLTLDDKIKLSASLCAQVSYRKSDYSISKALDIYDRLVTSTPKHLSPFEHQATPAKIGIHISGNFRGWKQYRQTIENNVCKKYILN